MRECGILYPISSLPSKYGIGCFSREAYEFVDFLKVSGQSYWQILPLSPTGFGDSPYAAFSTFAGNPYFICLETLTEEGLLLQEECESIDWGSNPEAVDYGKIYAGRQDILKKAYERFKDQAKTDPEYLAFLKESKEWLEDYCLFMALKKENDDKPWSEWDTPYRIRDKKALAVLDVVIAECVDFYRFQQFEFSKQWKKLRTYANERNIRIIGDIPFYVAFDSADSWAHPELFQFDEQKVPVSVAGCPPDVFSSTGQLWGNPVYDWAYHKKTDYAWWISRMKRCYEFYDVVRIDHFRGFDEYYAIPYGDETAENGIWEKGPGYELFEVMKEELGELGIIAEDLGYITDSVRELLEECGFPGMKILQFAFDASENSAYLPYKHERNSVVYTGTHDNEPTRGWIETISDHDRDYVRRYIHSMYTDYNAFTWDFIREAMRSVADLCIIPIQDYLVKGSYARINSPSTNSGNWQWRVVPDLLSEDLARSVHALTWLYGRGRVDPPVKAPEETEEDISDRTDEEIPTEGDLKEQSPTADHESGQSAGSFI